MLAEELAPRPDLADAMADERASGEGRPDTLVQVVDAFTTLAKTLEFSMGAEAALAHLRAMNRVQVERACGLGWAYRDAEAAAEQAELQLRNAKVAGYDGLLGELHEQVRRSRSEWTACALAPGRRPTRRGAPRRRSTATRAASRGGAGRARRTACSCSN